MITQANMSLTSCQTQLEFDHMLSPNECWLGELQTQHT